MSFTNYLEDAVLKHVFGATSMTKPATLYLALFTAAPGETGGGTEVSGGSYARQAVAFTISGTAPTQAANSAQIDFPAATAAWGTITHAAIFDAATGGNMLDYTALSSSLAIASGEIARLAAGQYAITLE